MPTILLCSPNGGVGKTTLAANLATNIASTGQSTTIIELSDQNILQYHFGTEVTGQAIASLKDSTPADCAEALAAASFRVDENLRLIPYSLLNRNDAGATQNEAVSFAADLAACTPFNQDVVIIDGANGPVKAFSGPGNIDLALYVLRADLSSAAALMHFDPSEADGALGADVRFVLNQIDSRRPLCRDVEVTMKSALGERLIACIGYDEAAAEAFGRNVLTEQNNPCSAVMQDMAVLGKNLAEHLNKIESVDSASDNVTTLAESA